MLMVASDTCNYFSANRLLLNMTETDRRNKDFPPLPPLAKKQNNHVTVMQTRYHFKSTSLLETLVLSTLLNEPLSQTVSKLKRFSFVVEKLSRVIGGQFLHEVDDIATGLVDCQRRRPAASRTHIGCNMTGRNGNGDDTFDNAM